MLYRGTFKVRSVKNVNNEQLFNDSVFGMDIEGALTVKEVLQLAKRRGKFACREYLKSKFEEILQVTVRPELPQNYVKLMHKWGKEERKRRKNRKKIKK